MRTYLTPRGYFESEVIGGGQYLGTVQTQPHPTTGLHYFSCGIRSERPCSSQESNSVDDDQGYDSPNEAAEALGRHVEEEHAGVLA